MRDAIMQMIEKEKIIAIVRGVASEQCVKVAKALYDGGIRLVEVTFNQKRPDTFQDTADAIAAISQKFDGNMLIGAGTVTTTEQVEMAAKAGAGYIISPNVNIEVIQRTLELGMVSIPGALTPSEIMTAHCAGADYVKLFPVGCMGVDYIKAVLAPVSHVKMLAVGGVNSSNAAEFLRAGMCGVGVGGNLANKKWIEADEYCKITDAACEMVNVVKAV